MLYGFQLSQISRDEPDFLGALKEAGLSANGLERAEAYALQERETVENVAYAAVEIYAPDAMLRSLVCPPEHRGMGYGTALCQLVFPYVQSRGVSTVYALTETAPGFFSTLGFEKTTRNSLPEQIARTPLVANTCGAKADVYKITL